MVGRVLQVGRQALTMSDLVGLVSGDASRANVSTRGAALVGLTLSGVELIPACASSEAESYFAGSTLAPWPNRLAGSSWNHEGQRLSHLANDGLGNANHGLVFDREFAVTERSADSITMAYTIEPSLSPVYPFRVRVEVACRLENLALHVRLAATNLSENPAPVALGSHPYFAAPDGATLTLNASSVGLDGESMIPGRRGDVAEIGLRPGRPVEIAGLTLDHEFSGFATSPRATIETPNGYKIHIDQGAELAYQMVFVAEDFPWDAGAAPAIAIEPQSAAIDSFNNGLGLRTLASGETWSAQWAVSVER